MRTKKACAIAGSKVPTQSCTLETSQFPRAAASGTHVLARIAQSVERKALNLVVVGSSPTSGGCFFLHFFD